MLTLRINQIFTILIFLTTFIVAGCSGVTYRPSIDESLALAEAERQRELFISDLLQANSRVQGIYGPLITENHELCESSSFNYLGATFFHSNQFSTDFQQAAGKILGSTEQVVVWDVFFGTPAATAGLQKGDLVLQVGKVKVGSLQEFRNEMQKKFADEGSFELKVQRNQQIITNSLIPEKACAYPLALNLSNNLNAFADGKNVVISIGMVDFLKNDNEIALVLGHEIAHNALGHVDKKQSNALVGALIGGLLVAVAGVGVDAVDAGAQIGAQAFSQEFEAEADYVGVYYAARAGYEVGEVANIWRRIASRNPSAIDLVGTTHPSSAVRFLLIEQTALEIKDKKLNGLSLIPNLESDR